jgi:hypothetical protein
MTFQLNVNLVLATKAGQYVYWVQNVASLDTSSRVITFLDNVWNVSSKSADIDPSAISGNGTVSPSKAGAFYADVASDSLAGNNVALTYPVTIIFNVTSSLSPSGEPMVSLAYDDGEGLVTYDVVTFETGDELTSMKGFEVDGFDYNPSGIFNDFELILGGSGGGLSTTAVQSDVRLQLEYWNGHNYEMVPNAYNFGSDTAETIGNVLSQFSHSSSNGEMFAEITPGAGQLGSLYNDSQTGRINITTTLSSGILYITNASNPNATGLQCPFVDGGVAVRLFPGRYSVKLYDGSEIYDQGAFTLNANETLSLQTPFTKAAHNLAVTSVQLARTVIGEGFGDNVTVGVVDNGENAEIFNVTLYASSTLIGNAVGINVNSTGTVVLTFVWETTGLAKGSYVISASVEPVPGETDTADNTLVDGQVRIVTPGDVDADGVVNVLDVAGIARLFGLNSHSVGYNANMDINFDGKIDILDIAIVGRNFGKTS